MRLRERDKRSVTVFPWTGTDEDAYAWGEGTVIRAAVYPLGESLSAELFGDRAQDKKLLLCDGSTTLSVGMGVSLGGGAPDYRIVRLETWAHMRAELERIPEGRRGDAV